MKIVIIGTGNTATILGKKMVAAGHLIMQVVGRREAAARALAAELGAEPVDRLPTVSTYADLYLMAVPDDAIEVVAAGLPLKGQTIVHTAASVSKEVLKKKTGNYGVLYPLQTMKKEVTQLPPIPFLIDAGNERTLKLLEGLAQTIGTSVTVAGDAQRIKTHLAAVMINNFTNHLFALVENYCLQESLDFSLLLPLIEETVFRLNDLSPLLAQTGPAVRGDMDTINKHLALLQPHPQLQHLYAALTDSIRLSAVHHKQEHGNTGLP